MKKLLLFFMGVSSCISMYSQGVTTPLQDWTSTTGSQNFFQKSVMKTDGSSNVYVAGATITGAGTFDILVSKTSSAGVLLWTKQYDGAAHFQDAATDLYIDNSGNVYVTGFVTNDSVYHYSDCITIKYNSSGVQQWASTFDGSGSLWDSGAKVIEDGTGNVYVTGVAYNSTPNTDAIAIKYNSSGTQQWATQYDGTSNLNDAGVKNAIVSGQLVVVGTSQTGTTTYKPLTLKLNLTTGAVISATYSTSGSTNMGIVNDVLKDATGNIYIVGATAVTGHGYDFTTIKLTATTLALAWEVDFNGASSLDDIASGVQVDGSGNVYVTGYTTSSTQQKDMMTIKYNSSGTQQWNVTYNDTLNGNDAANALVLDASNNVYVTGYDSTSINNADYYTIKYNSSGTQQWSIRSDGDAHMDDIATNIALDTVGNIIVTGESKKADGTYEYKTIRYVQKSIITPTDYNSENPSSSFLYFENKGQLIQSDSTPATSIRYYTNGPYPAFYFKENSLSMIFAHIDTVLATNDSLQRIDMTFDQVNAKAKTYPLEERSTYLNYFLANCPTNGITEVHGNQRLITTNLYPNIDLIYYSNQNGFKYYFIVKPGGDPTNIKMEYTGASSFNLDTTAHSLTINSLVGSITYDRPTVYQLDASNVVDSISGWHADWLTNGASNKYKFNIGAFNNTKALIIEIDQGNAAFATSVVSNKNLEWSTFLGSSVYDDSRDVVSGPTNNVFVTGSTITNHFLASAGITVMSYSGLSDAFVAKFDNTAINTWIAFIGGSSSDYAVSIAVDKVENIYLVGKTTSSDFINYSSSGINYSTLQGTQDGFYINLKNTGTVMLCDSYLGGASNKEEPTAIALKESGAVRDVYIVGWTDNTSGFPLLSTGAYYQSSIAGGYDGFIMKLDASNNRQWCSLFGGSGSDLPTDIAMRPGNNNPVIVGHTSSSVYDITTCATPTGGGFPFCNNSGTYYSQASGGGSSDDMIVEFNNTTQALVWSTFFGGSGQEQLYLFTASDAYKTPNIAITTNNDVYVSGSCYSGAAPTFPLLNSTNGGIYNQPWTGTGSGMYEYIARFNSSRQQTWTSFIGDGSTNLPLGICSDPNNTVYITGWSDVTTVQSTGNYCTVPTSFDFPICNHSNLNYLETNATTKRMYIHAFNSSDNIVWSTLFGQNTNANGSGISATSTKLFVSGLVQLDNTLWDYNTSSTLDYFKNSNPSDFDASIARFDITTILTGINDENNDNEQTSINIFPNPANDFVTVQFKEEVKSDYQIIVLDATGRIVIEKKYDKTQKLVKFDIKNLTNGMYFIQIISPEIHCAGKFIKS